MDFFGLASMSASGWVASDGQFALSLNGDLSLGGGGFGLFGSFGVGVKLTKNPATQEFSFRVKVDASVRVKAFGITLAGAGIHFDLTASGSGKVDLEADFDIEIELLFFTIHKNAHFYIGTIQLPKVIHLAGQPGNTDLDYKSFTGGVLVLNTGTRAGIRGVGDGITNESYIVEHVAGTAGNETVRVKAFGREQIFTGVTKIVADGGSGNDTFLMAEGLLSEFDLSGGVGEDVFIINGGYGVLHGDGDDDYFEAAGQTGSLTIWGGGGNDYIVNTSARGVVIHGEAGNDTIFGGTGNDTITGDADADYIETGGGDDAVDGGLGNDRIRVLLPTVVGLQLINGGGDSDELIIVGSGNNDDLLVTAGADDARISRMSGLDRGRRLPHPELRDADLPARPWRRPDHDRPARGQDGQRRSRHRLGRHGGRPGQRRRRHLHRHRQRQASCAPAARRST